MSESTFPAPALSADHRRPGPALAMLRAGLQRVSRDWRGPGLRLELPGGETVTAGPLDRADTVSIRVRNYRCVSRLLTAGDIGFAEGYMAGEWDTPDLAPLLTVLAENFDGLKRLGLGGPLSQMAHKLLKLLRRNTVEGSRRNIYAHYDLGNAFYEAWLDPGMTYSSALYDEPSAFGPNDDALEAAQTRKYAALARDIGLQPGQEVLEIGCGWGGFAEFAAREVGAKVTGLTISAAQHAYASERMHKAGLAERADIRLCDYRHAEGRFDGVVSIEMFEAVGERWWPTFFDRVHDRLKPGGRAGLQIITIRDDLFDHYRSRVDFIQKHVFPGGMLPSESRLREESGKAGLSWSEPRRFGPDYARTLRRWDERFQEAWSALKQQGFDERFRRLWRFYLAYCEAGFATGRTDVLQVALAKP
jgi:cyclopropane-fatty-acyl-phospholipid synthase